MQYLGIDVGGTSIKAGLVTETGKVLESRRTPTITDDLSALLSTLTELVREFQKSAAIECIGIGIPGLHNSKTQVIETSPNIRALHHVNLGQLVADQVHIRTVSENDANAAAYAEFTCGAGAGLRHVAHLTLGTGFGSGIVLNGSLFVGTSGYAAELGHTIVSAPTSENGGGRLCTCGNRGCIEAYVSATGIVRTAEELMKKTPDSLLHNAEWPLTSERIFEIATQGDATAQRVFRETGRYLGISCANLINLLNLEMIILGGGVLAAGGLLMDSTIESAKHHAFPSSYADCRIVQSKLWPDAGLIGAAMLARDA